MMSSDVDAKGAMQNTDDGSWNPGPMFTAQNDILL